MRFSRLLLLKILYTTVASKDSSFLTFPDSRQALTETVMARQSVKFLIKERCDASLPLKWRLFGVARTENRPFGTVLGLIRWL